MILNSLCVFRVKHEKLSRNHSLVARYSHPVQFWFFEFLMAVTWQFAAACGSEFIEIWRGFIPCSNVAAVDEPTLAHVTRICSHFVHSHENKQLISISLFTWHYGQRILYFDFVSTSQTMPVENIPEWKIARKETSTAPTHEQSVTLGTVSHLTIWWDRDSIANIYQI